MRLALSRRPSAARAPASAPPAPSVPTPLPVGRADAPEERAADAMAGAVLRRAPSVAGGGGGGRMAPPAVHEVLSAPGEALAPGARGEMEGRFGHDFGRVRVHHDARAAASAEAVAARAYAVGPHLVFGPGQYAPDRADGRRLLAHELAHVVQHEAGAAPAVRRNGKTPPDPTWSEAEIKEIQRRLKALGLYGLTVDGGLGEGTKSGLVEAFGDESWRTMTGPDVSARLATAVKPAGKAGEHAFRYGEMFKDGILDITLTLGFDEADSHVGVFTALKDVLTARKFVKDADAARALYKQAGRALPKSAYGLFYVKRDAFTWTPPAGKPRSVHAVVRLATSLTGKQGARVAEVQKEAMTESDATFYAGHGRYGTGPDFDPLAVVQILDATGKPARTIEDYSVLEDEMAIAGKKNGRTAWEEFLHEVKAGRIKVVGSTAGNVRMTKSSPGRKEFGRRLLDWTLDRDKKALTPGKGGAMDAAAAAHPERKYRVLVFNGCITNQYEKSIRSTPGFGTQSTDILATKKTIYWGEETPAFEAFLDGILAQQSAEKILKDMDAGRGAFTGSGIEDNPVVPK